MVKRLIGGLILLNLTSISLGLTSGEVDITDSGVLEQLKELRSFIDAKRDFSKTSKELKPVLVQYRSSASKIDGVVQCNMEFNTDALHLNICGTSIQKDGTPLTITINVIYEYTDYVGYTIKTAKLNATQNQPIFETIVDKNGNKRFIEDDITPETISGVTFSYTKWGLSGNHLMIVICGSVEDEVVLQNGQNLATFELPDFIFEKIAPIVGSVVVSSTTSMWASNYTTQNLQYNFLKNTEDVSLKVGQDVTLTSDKTFRIEINLFIDND